MGKTRPLDFPRPPVRPENPIGLLRLRLTGPGQMPSSIGIGAGRPSVGMTLGSVRHSRLRARLESIVGDQPSVRERQACVHRIREFEEGSARGASRTGAYT